MTSSNFAETIIGEATMDAVDKLAADVHGANLNGGADSRENDLDALVADVSGNTITINAGTAAGLRRARRSPSITRARRSRTQPPAKCWTSRPRRSAQLTITMVRDRISMGTYRGAGRPVVGDVVRK